MWRKKVSIYAVCGGRVVFFKMTRIVGIHREYSICGTCGTFFSGK